MSVLPGATPPGGTRTHPGSARHRGAPAGSAPVGSAPAGSAPAGSAPVGSAPAGSAPVGSAPVAGSRRSGGGAAALVLAATAGAALVLATPPVGWWPLAPLGPALLVLAVRCGGTPRHPWAGSAGLAALTAAVYLLPVLSWAQAPGVDAWLGLTVAEVALFCLVGPGLRLVARLPAAPLWAAAVWVADEALRDSEPFGGFPWARLAFTQPDTVFTRLAAVGGAPLVSFAVALCGTCLAAAVLHLRGRSRRGAAAALTGALLVGAAGGLVGVRTGAGARQVTVAVVQGSVPQAGYAPFRRKRLVTEDHVAETRVLARAVARGQLPRPRFVVWPENSSDLDPFHDPASAALLDQASQAVGTPLLVGAVLLGPRPGTVYNAGLAWGPQGYLGERYIKRHPVPFGEYLPYRPELSRWFSQFRRLLPNDFLPGRRPGLLHLAGVPVADVICFEVAFDPIVRQAVDAGGQLLVVQTNNATFGRSGESPQQLAMARLRAIEHDRTTIVASTTGISALIAPDGHLLASTREFTPAVLDAAVPLQTARTVADRIGDAPDLAICALAALAALAGAGQVWAGRRRRI